MRRQNWSQVSTLLVRSAVQSRSLSRLHGKSSPSFPFPSHHKPNLVAIKGRLEDGLKDWTMAMKEKYTQEHDVIDEAYLDNGAVSSFLPSFHPQPTSSQYVNR